MDKRCRAIIFKDGNIILMKRTFPSRTFYVFPGGKMEDGETREQCVEREVKEEFNLAVKAKKLVYETTDKNKKEIQYYFLCEYVSGEIEKTDAEEYTTNDVSKYGEYEPTSTSLLNLQTLTLYPEEVHKELLLDLKEFGENLCENVKKILTTYKK